MHVGSFIAACVLFLGVRRLLSSCGMQVFSSLFVAHGSRVRELCSLRHAGSLVETHGLSICGTRA